MGRRDITKLAKNEFRLDSKSAAYKSTKFNSTMAARTLFSYTLEETLPCLKPNHPPSSCIGIKTKNAFVPEDTQISLKA